MSLECRDRIEPDLRGRQPQPVNFVPVQERAVEIADFLLVGAGSRMRGGARRDYRLDVQFRLFFQHLQGAPTALIGGNLFRGEPAPVHVAIEVIPRLDRLILGGEIDAEAAELWSIGIARYTAA